MKYFIDVLKKYAVFKGRASRKDYWMFILFYFIFAILLGIITSIVSVMINFNLSFLGTIYSLIFFLPHIALLVRRAHDSNKSGWFILVPIYNIVLLFLESTPGDNQYGPNPKGIQSDTSTTSTSNPTPTTSQFVKYDNSSTPTTPTSPQPEQPTNTQ